MNEQRKRNNRNNHKAASSITDVHTMQIYAQSVIEATFHDKPSTMFNGSGFVTPQILGNYDTDNLLRLCASIVHSIGLRMHGDTDDYEQARQALRLVANFASHMRDYQENARNERILRQADEIRKNTHASFNL